MKSDSASAPLRSILGSKEFLSRIVATANALKQTTIFLKRMRSMIARLMVDFNLDQVKVIFMGEKITVTVHGVECCWMIKIS